MNAVPDIEIGVAEVAARRAAGESLFLLDVREEWEFALAHLEGAQLLPLGQIPARMAELTCSPDTEVICYCHHGQRSLTAADWLRRAGWLRARSMAGGVEQWARTVDVAFPRY